MGGGSILRIALVTVLFQTVIGLQILNSKKPNQNMFTISVELGSSTVLECDEVLNAEEGENFATNIVKWHKTQKAEEMDTPSAGVEIASLATIVDTFRVTQRFQINFIHLESTIKVAMSISDIQEEDSGWYTCFATADSETFWIRYLLQVYVAPSSVMLYGMGTAEVTDESVTGPLLFSSTEDGVLICTSMGSNPAPILRMRIEGEDKPLTGYGDPESVYELKGDVEGMQKIHYNTTITVSHIQIRADQNGKKAFCTASDTDGQREPISASRVLSVLYPPKVLDCNEDWKANVNDVNIKFRCTFEANPVPNVLWKSLDRVQTDIYPNGKIVDNLYSAQVKATTMKTAGNISIFQTDLNLLRITEDSYHSYKLELSNKLGTVSKEFVLNPGERDDNEEAMVVHGDASFVTSSCVVICVITLTALLFQQ